MTRKILILPLEIVRRELDARLLHALFALQRGWDVFIGANAIVNRMLWKFPRSVFLLTTLTHNRLYLARLLKKAGFAIQGWDEEGLIYKDRDVYLTRRVSSETLAHVDQIFTWGEAGARDVNLRAAKVGKQAIPLGNPRLDLLRPELRPLYAAEVQKIRDSVGDFVLLNTNFPSVNLVVKRGIQYTKRSSPKDQEFRRQADIGYRRFIAHRKFMFRAFQELIPALASALPAGIKLVLRPHPAENIAPWQALARMHENVVIATDGPVVPWVLAAQALIHNDCTTAVEARLLGKEPIAYMPPGMPVDGACFLPNAVSHKAPTVDDLMDVLHAIRTGRIENADLAAILDEHVSAQRGKMAAERAVEHAEKLAEIIDFGAQPLHLRAFCLLRHGWKKILAYKHTDAYIDRVFPPLHTADIEQRLLRMGRLLDIPTSDITVQKMNHRLFLLHKTR